MKTRILVVDDEKTITDLVGIYLRNEGYEVQLAYNGADAAQAILTQEFDLAILDIMLPDIDGFELLRTIRTDYTFRLSCLPRAIRRPTKSRVCRSAQTITWLNRSARLSSWRA